MKIRRLEFERLSLQRMMSCVSIRKIAIDITHTTIIHLWRSISMVQASSVKILICMLIGKRTWATKRQNKKEEASIDNRKVPNKHGNN